MNWSCENRRWRVAVLTMALVALAGCSTGDGAERTASSPKATSASALRIPSGPELPGVGHFPGFAADGSGFALLAECPGEAEGGAGSRAAQGCAQHVAVLDKGASAWRLAASPLPKTLPPDGITADLIVLGPGRALITEGHALQADRTWYTRDRGRTWRAGTTRPSGTTTSVPDGGRLVADCVRPDDENNGCARSRLAVIMPDTGRYLVLAQQPPLGGQLVPGSELPGGVLTAAGRLGDSPGTGALGLALSKDRGRTWTVADLPGTGAKGWTFEVSSAKGVLYAAQRGGLPAGIPVKNGLLTLHSSKDGGRTWTRTWRFRPGVELRSILGVPVAAADGSLSISSEDGSWRSTDGGRTFARTSTGGRPTGWIWHTPIGYLVGNSTDAVAYRTSADGISWRDFTLGSG